MRLLPVRAQFISENDEHELMTSVQNNWQSKVAIITSRNHIAGEMIPIKENIYQLSIAMILRRNSYFTEVFNDVIYKLLANGYISELCTNLKKKKHTTRTSSTGFLSINDVVGLFRICLCGYFLAIVVFGYEMVSMILQKKKKTERK